MTLAPRIGNITSLSGISEVRALLEECGLPVSDISLDRHRFFGIRSGGSLIAVAGLESLGLAGLLRSLAVAPGHRHHGLARQLVCHVERVAAGEGIAELYLLTTTARTFFEKIGYRQLARTEAPVSVQSTSQFAGLCPLSSDMLSKRLEQHGASV